MTEDTLFTPPVSKQEKNMRLDKFLAGCFSQFSRSRLQKIIEEGDVTLEDVVISDNSHKVKENDVYCVTEQPPEDASILPEDIKLDILFEDDDILVVNKPAGMTVHPAAGINRGTLVNALLYHCAGSLSGIGGVIRPGIVHRIDKETSGLLVVAKNDAAHRFLSEQFAEHSIERTYCAVVYGVLNPLCGRIEGNIARSNFDRKKMAMVQAGGKYAATNYKTIEVFGRTASLVQCNLETGRTHQIRVHLSSKGANLIGDKVYVKNKKSSVIAPAQIKAYINNFPRQALHAASLGFVHPKTKQQMNFCSDLPADMKELVEILQKI